MTADQGRLLSGLRLDDAPVGLAEHLERWGPFPRKWARSSLIDEVDASGLAGHGGAWFPVATKWRDVHRGRRAPVVVANGSEGEPASEKDALLLSRVPHLVLDGATCAAAALGAVRVVVMVPQDCMRVVRSAVIERQRMGLDPVEIEVIAAVDSFIAGQESAVVNALDSRLGAVPTFVGLDSIRRRGVGGRPTLVQNVETLANVALIARFGAGWFRSLGTEQYPGTMLLTVHGLSAGPTVIETPIGSRAGTVLGIVADDFQGALLGGYGGGWISTDTLMGLPLEEASARRANTSLGAGVVALLPHSVCPLSEVARTARYLASQSAGQCGPCAHGLPALAGELEDLAFGPARRQRNIEEIMTLCSLVEGRGACRHPDGVSRFVRTACAVFAHEVSDHLTQGPCRRVSRPPCLPLSGQGSYRALVAQR